MTYHRTRSPRFMVGIGKLPNINPLIEALKLAAAKLRHAVCTAEKRRSSWAEICEQCPYFGILCNKPDCGRTDCSASLAVLMALFSGRHMRSPVPVEHQGECNAIRSRGICPRRVDSCRPWKPILALLISRLSGPIPKIPSADFWPEQ